MQALRSERQTGCAVGTETRLNDSVSVVSGWAWPSVAQQRWQRLCRAAAP